MLQQFIYANYITCLIIFFMTIFLLTNNTFERRTARFFMCSILFTFLLIAADTVESQAASLNHPTMLRVFSSAIGYTVRPLCILCILEIVAGKKRSGRILLALPAAINGVIAFSALFTDAAFGYTEENEFVRGPLGWSAYIVSGIYLLILIIVSVVSFVDKNYYESMLVIAITAAAVASVAVEVFWEYEGAINATIALSIAFYYIYFHTQTFKRDSLTHALNRRCFYMDAEKDRDFITAVISLDLNNLKLINDSQGHDAGDAAICTLAACAEKNLLKGCRLYRIGGDEFSILCMKEERKQLEAMVQNIKASMAETEYSCAIGMSMVNGRSNLDEVCTDADKAMYRDKIQMKRTR